MPAAKTTRGHCLCGAIRFEFQGEPKWAVHCHCESCRRATSSPMTTWISVPVEKFRYVEGNPHYYKSSPGARRSFCSRCGSPMSYEHERYPGEIHLYAVSLEKPDEVAPRAHVFFAEKLAWLDFHDDLPRFATTSAGGTPPIGDSPKKT